MAVTLSSTLTDVTFDDQPNTLLRNIGNDIETYTFSDGDDSVIFRTKTSDRLVITYTTSSFGKVKWLNDIMDAQYAVDITGLDDNNLNASYLIDNLNVVQDTSMYDDSGLYKITIALERKYDELF